MREENLEFAASVNNTELVGFKTWEEFESQMNTWKTQLEEGRKELDRLQPTEKPCPDNWTHVQEQGLCCPQGYTYIFEFSKCVSIELLDKDTTNTQDDVNAYCEKNGATAVTIENQEQNEIIVKLAKDSAYVAIGLQIPFNEPWSKTGFKWVDGSKSIYTNFNTVEPNNYNNEDERIAAIHPYDSEKWHDISAKAIMLYDKPAIACSVRSKVEYSRKLVGNLEAILSSLGQSLSEAESEHETKAGLRKAVRKLYSLLHESNFQLYNIRIFYANKKALESKTEALLQKENNRISGLIQNQGLLSYHSWEDFNNTCCPHYFHFNPVFHQCVAIINFSKDTKSQKNINNLCEHRGSKAITIRNEKENKELNNLIEHTLGAVIGYQIPDSEDWSKDNFKWVDGSHSTYTNWDHSEPQNYHRRNPERLTVIARRSTGKWFDVNAETAAHQYNYGTSVACARPGFIVSKDDHSRKLVSDLEQAIEGFRKLDTSLTEVDSGDEAKTALVKEICKLQALIQETNYFLKKIWLFYANKKVLESKTDVSLQKQNAEITIFIQNQELLDFNSWKELEAELRTWIIQVELKQKELLNTPAQASPAQPKPDGMSRNVTYTVPDTRTEEEIQHLVCPDGFKKSENDICCPIGFIYKKSFGKCVTFSKIQTKAEPKHVSEIFQNCPKGSQPLTIKNTEQNDDINIHFQSVREDHDRGFVIGLHIPVGKTVSEENFRWADNDNSTYRLWDNHGVFHNTGPQAKKNFVCTYVWTDWGIGSANRWSACDFETRLQFNYGWLACGAKAAELVGPENFKKLVSDLREAIKTLGTLGQFDSEDVAKTALQKEVQKLETLVKDSQSHIQNIWLFYANKRVLEGRTDASSLQQENDKITAFIKNEEVLGFNSWEDFEAQLRTWIIQVEQKRKELQNTPPQALPVPPKSVVLVCPDGFKMSENDFCCPIGFIYKTSFGKCVTIAKIQTETEPKQVSEIFQNCPKSSKPLTIKNAKENKDINTHFLSVRRGHERGFVIGLHFPIGQAPNVQNLQWADKDNSSYRPWTEVGPFGSTGPKIKKNFVCSYNTGKTNKWFACDFETRVRANYGYYDWIACGAQSAQPVDSDQKVCSESFFYMKSFDSCVNIFEIKTKTNPENAQEIFDNCPKGSHVMTIKNAEQNKDISDHFLKIREDRHRGFLIGLHVPFGQSITLDNMKWADGDNSTYRFWHSDGLFSSWGDKNQKHFVCTYTYDRSNGWDACDFETRLMVNYDRIACTAKVRPITLGQKLANEEQVLKKAQLAKKNRETRACPKNYLKTDDQFCCPNGFAYQKSFGRCVAIFRIRNTAAPKHAQEIFANCPAGSKPLTIKNSEQNMDINQYFYRVRRGHEKGFVIGLHIPIGQRITENGYKWADGDKSTFRYWSKEGPFDENIELNKNFVCTYIIKHTNEWFACDFANQIKADYGFFDWIACGVELAEPLR
ncbi:hypothetical protein L596_026494 [Steinernema carpocapsae]|uniref:C-type lectin domain-containing protein n=1 Tax=Steinernema carpocapsae TaxID=34508 RepID=A0A4U5M1J5_STECR|nr:hypothetical protein L596_026494 [Steinernema carpocapsae]